MKSSQNKVKNIQIIIDWSSLRVGQKLTLMVNGINLHNHLYRGLINYILLLNDLCILVGR